jgi:hypothetical protein
MSVGRLRQIGISLALGSCLALGCRSEKSEAPAGEKSEAPAPAPAAAAPVPTGNHETLPNFATLPTIELPGNFPDDVPRYPGARVVKATVDTEANWVAQFVTPDDPAKVYANLSDTFAGQGWSTERADMPDGIFLYARKGDRSVTYAFESIKGATTVSLIILQQQP